MMGDDSGEEGLVGFETESGGNVDGARTSCVLVIRENIKVRRFVRYEGGCCA